MTGTWIVTHQNGKRTSFPFTLNRYEIENLVRDPDNTYRIYNLILMRGARVGKGKGFPAIEAIAGP